VKKNTTKLTSFNSINAIRGLAPNARIVSKAVCIAIDTHTNQYTQQLYKFRIQAHISTNMSIMRFGFTQKKKSSIIYIIIILYYNSI